MTRTGTRRGRRDRRSGRKVGAHGEQLSLLDASGTRVRRDRRGGKRKGAGRPPKGKRAGSPHKEREELAARHPVHVVLRVERVLGTLRRRKMYGALRAATLALAISEAVAKHGGMRIVHVSIQRTHVHLLVEAAGKVALARGMQAFQISAAKHMNAALGWEIRRRGRVFCDRYHAEVVTSRRGARNALSYVLNNWRKHRETTEKYPQVDPFSSARAFAGWREEIRPAGSGAWEPLAVQEPQTWLLRVGWEMYGAISAWEVPSERAGLTRAQVG